MRHRNAVRQLGRSHSHRKAMYGNMVTSFFKKERIITTKQKGKELKKISEKLITRAVKSLSLPKKDESGRLHNKREVMKVIKDRDVVKKLFEIIAPRFKERKGGYTRLYLLGKQRAGDAAEMAIIELVVREKVEKAAPKKETEAKDKKEKKEKPAAKVVEKKEPEKKQAKEKEKGKDKKKEKAAPKEKDKKKDKKTK